MSKTLAVQLGRFAPYHLGHQKITQAMIDKHGIANCLIMIGSSNMLPNRRTPFTYEQRKQMVQTIWSNLKVVPLPDTNPEMINHPTDTAIIDVWLKQIKQIENQMQVEFIFYGGAVEDLKYLARQFKTEVIVDRTTEGENISATKIRGFLGQKNYSSLEQFIDSRLIPLLERWGTNPWG